MRKFLYKAAALFAAFVLTFNSADFSALPVRAEETSAETAVSGEAFLSNVIGEYVPLFEGTTFDAKYDKYWHDFSAAVVGESMADMCVAMMKSAIGAKTYGKDAGEEFCCGFIGDVARINFGGADGTEVTYTFNDGKKVKHTYAFVKEANATGVMEGQETAMGGFLYKSIDGNKDEFTYLFMCPDTPDTTYHLEFRYGDSEKNILKLTDGKYKNWLAAGFPTEALKDPDETLLKQCLGLFVLENLAAMSGEECNAQRASMAGAWDMDTTLFKDYPGYENASMYMVLDSAGTGKSYVDMTGSGEFLLASEYPFYIYGTKNAEGDENGVYLVISDDEGVKTATYTITGKDGKRVLTFVSSEGELTYYEKSDQVGAPAITKSTVKDSKKLVLKWTKAENADGYEVLISTSKKFKNAKTVTVEGKNTAKVKKLKKKNYYVKVRAFATGADGSKVYGEYSDVIVVKNK